MEILALQNVEYSYDKKKNLYGNRTGYDKKQHKMKLLKIVGLLNVKL